ncbi:fructosamine kinase family protein [Schlegelella sp. S2-27]|uniref:Fructosamine kinase family protein n=1 Tax=Caldimonas mangrovi TaxID=2944811 RepID=A0ABT0YTZ0_9BURK|nr:fructosamine kinase family protein [Caldimonas mangrovi]MCM5682222.1 fructosamine kinase family protein [Caldimonas mangrovi]
MNDSETLARSLTRRFGGRWSAQPLRASSFCSTWHARGRGMDAFVKSLPMSSAPVLEAEADGLDALAATRTVAVPAVHGCWCDEEAGLAVLAMQWMTLRLPDAGFGERFGRALGALHRALPPAGGGCFGWHRDNMLGGTPQRNRWSAHGGRNGWIAFVAHERLGALNARLAHRGAPAALRAAVDQVIAALPGCFDDGYAPRASLVHGDLWSGNWAMLTDGTPVVYDPAVSCSDAEAELAMMELFGGPPSGFWQAYRQAAGLHEGYPRRRALYQLYHLLNHVLLFGGSYEQQALACAHRLLKGSG